MAGENRSMDIAPPVRRSCAELILKIGDSKSASGSKDTHPLIQQLDKR